MGRGVHVARAHVRMQPLMTSANPKPLSWWDSMCVPNLSTVGTMVVETQQGDFGRIVHVARVHVALHPNFDSANSLAGRSLCAYQI